MKHCIVVWPIFVSFCWLLPAVSQGTGINSSVAEDTELEKRVTGFVQPLIDNRWTRGMIVGVWKNGKEDYFRFGSISEQNANSPDKDTVFEIGSITKVFTALVLADMASKGEVALDDPVQKYLSDDIKVPTPGGKPITLESLASHQSGMTNIPINFWQPGDNIYDNNVGGLRWGEFSTDKLREFFAQPYPPFEKSRKFIYSNLGMGTLGFALEQHAGESLEELIASRICEPLGLNSTGFLLETTGPGHNADGKVVKNWPINNSIIGGAFALRSTCADMLKFGVAHLNLSTPLKPAMKQVITPRGKISAGQSIGLGWRINQFQVISSNGATGGFRATIFIHPPSKTVVVAMVNSQFGGVVGGRKALFEQAAGNLVNVVLGAPTPDLKLPAVAKTDVDQLQDYVGTWKKKDGARNPRIPIRVENSMLMMIGPGNIDMRLWPSKKDTFFTRSYDGEIRFDRDDSGKIIDADFQFDQNTANMIRVEK